MTICTFFEECVARYPQAPALTFKNGTVSYQDLNNKINQLAHYLKSLGLPKEIVVATMRGR